MMKHSLYTVTLLFMCLVFVFCTPVFYDDDTENKPIAYPHEFASSSFRNLPVRVFLNQSGKLTEMTRTQLSNSVFGTFWDSMPAYANIKAAKLPFNGVEILDKSRIRLFNKETQFDTVVSYNNSGDLEHRVEIKYKFGNQEHIYAEISNYSKPKITFFPHWLFYTYRPFLQSREYSDLELAMLNPPFFEFSQYLYFQSTNGYDVGHLDTVGVHWAQIVFE